MQQQTPPQGRLFPDPPKDQRPAAPRFASTATQPYEPQPRMHHTGAYPSYSSSRYTTSSLQTLHTQPVQTMPPMSSMPTAQAYQAAMQQTAQASVDGNPIIIQTVQGTPVLVTLEQLQAALKKQEKPADDKKPCKSRKEKKERKPRRFSIVWFVFGLIGMGTTAIAVLRVVITLLLKLKGAL